MDLKLHVKANHKTVFREAPVDSFGEPNSFWFSKFPKDYIRIIKPTRRDSQEARFSRRAVERWWPSVGSRASKSLADWREGWSCVPLITPSPSPVLDLEDKPTPSRHAIHQLIVGSDQVMAIIYMEFKSSVIWYKVTIDSRVLTALKELTSLLRRMSTIKPFNGVIPKRFGRALEGERLKFARNSLHKTLGIEASYLSVIYKTESVSFSEDTEEIEGPSKKKFKAIHQSPEMLFQKPTSEVESDAGLSSPRLNPNSASMNHTDSESIMDDTPTTSEGKQSSVMQKQLLISIIQSLMFPLLRKIHSNLLGVTRFLLKTSSLQMHHW